MKIRGQTVYTNKEKLERHSKKNIQTGCWEWQGCLRNGYGRMTVGSRTDGTRRSATAHRVSYEEYKGKIPVGMYVCHKCDNPKCINPDHLFLGTHQDNINDREKKGRNNHARKITDEDVEFIHKHKNIIKGKELAKKFDVSYDTIKQIWCGRIYPHLKPAPPQAATESED